MKTLIALFLAGFMSACSTVSKKRFAAVDPVPVISDGGEVPLRQNLKNLPGKLRTVVGAWVSYKLILFQLESKYVLAEPDTHPEKFRIDMDDVLPQCGGKSLYEVVNSAEFKISWSEEGQEMIVEFTK
jgi:hypothetical protein